MSEQALVERITRSLAFMLRHQPERFDLEIDAFGYADVDEVVRALNERLGEGIELDDVEGAVAAGDRPRYEIKDGRIRALYGHSIAVEPGEPSKPPETLYVAIPARDADRAKRFGLRGGRRRFLHLALSLEDACEAGRRLAREYTVLSIRAIDAWEEGIDFYDRQALWLAEEAPTHLLEVVETRDDGRDPRERGGPDRGRSRSSGGRGRSRRDSRGGRDERRGRSERRDSDDRPARRERDERPPRRERDERPDRRERDERPPRREREERPARAERPRETRREPEPTREVPRPAPAASPAPGFGAGLESAPEPAREPERAPEPTPEPTPEPAPEPPPAPAARQESDDTPSFGAGI
jgi:putative RNA 2'-phosphotransferase